MGERYSVEAVLSVMDKNFTQKMNSAMNSLEGLDDTSKKTSSSIMDIAKGVGAFKVVSLAADALKASLGDAIDRFDTMNQYPKVMQQIGFSAEKSEASINRLSDGIQGVPTSLDEIIASTQKLALLTGDLDKATDASIALNDAFYASGASSDDASRGLVQYTQMLSKGTVDIQSWRTLQETMGVALKEVAESFGYAGAAATNDLYAALQSGEITFDQFNDKLIELDGGVNGFAERAKTASAGIGTSLTNMGIAVVRGMESVVRSTNDALENNGLPGFQAMIEDATTNINAAFSMAADGTELFVGSLDVLVPVLGTATAGFVAYKAAIDVGDKYIEMKKRAADAADTLTAVKNKTELAAKATVVNQKATEAAASAELWSTKAHKYEEAALKAQTKAKELSTTASKAKKAADKAGAGATELQAVAEEAAALASAAQAEADKKAAIASKAKSVAETKETASTSLNTAAKTANTASETANAKAAAVSNVAIASKTALLGVLSGEYTIVEAGQLAWNAAMTANPIGTVIVAATALVAVVVGISKALEKLDPEAGKAQKRREEAIKSSKELVESLESTKDAYDENMSSIDAEASANEKLAGKIADLAKKESKSADEKAKLQSYVDSLNSSMEDLNLEYDAENDALSMSTSRIKAKVDAYKKQAEAQATQERYTEILKEQSEIDEKLAAIEKERAELEKEQQELVSAGPAKMGEYNKATAELTEQEEALNEKKKELAASEEHLTNVMEQCQTEQTEAVKTAQQEQQSALAESIANQTVQLENLSEANQETVAALQDAWQGYVDKATDMFDTLSDEQTLSVQDMIENLQKNQEVISQWGDNMEALRDRFANLGLSESVLDDLADMGPEGAGYVAALVGASDEQLQALAQSFDNGGEVAKESLLESLGVNGDEIPMAIQEMIKQTDTSLRETIEATDWSSIGGDITTGLAEGIDSGSEEVATSAGKLGTDAENSLRDTTQTHSPSALFESIGQDLVAGLAQGLMKNGMAKEAAVQMANSVVRAVQEAMDGADFSTAWNRAFSGMSNVASNSMSKVTSAVKTGMSASTAAVSSGTSSMQRAMNAGMTSMSAVVKTKMAMIEKQGVSSMSQFARAIADGMSRSKINAANGVSGIVSALTPMQSRFYNSGYYASIGLANGINAGSGRAIAAANRLANQVALTMEKALDVGSPSRVTRKIGGYTTEGFALGLLDDIREVKEAALEVAQMAIPSGDIAARVAYAGTYTPSNVYDNLNTEGATYTIVVPLSVDGREFARAAATYTQEELDSMEKFKNYRKGYR